MRRLLFMGGFFATLPLLSAQEAPSPTPVPEEQVASPTPAPQATPEVPQPPEAIEAKGQLKAFREVHLASRAKGVIREIKDEGTEIQEGDTVAVLEDALERLTVDQQRQVLALRAFEDKVRENLSKSDAISREDAMEKTINFEIAKIQLAQSVELLDRRHVVAPFHGYITERLRAAGESVDEFVPILTVVDLSHLYFEAYLPADQVRNVQEGQNAEVRIDTFPEKVFPGKVALKSPVVNPASLEFKIKILIDNPDLKLSAGLGGTCRILPAEAKPQG